MILPGLWLVNFLAKRLLVVLKVLGWTPVGTMAGDAKMRVGKSAMPTPSVVGAAAVHVVTKPLSIGTSVNHVGNGSGRIDSAKSEYTAPSTPGNKVCIIDPASAETAKGDLGAHGSLSGALYQQIRGG